MLIADTEGKLQYFLTEVSGEKGEERININCKKSECMVVSKKNIPICELQIGDTKINQIQQFRYLRSILTEKVKY